MSLEKRIEALEAQIHAGVTQHVKIDGYTVEVFGGSPSTPVYVPSKTGVTFHEDDSEIRLITGPYGSGKSTICCEEILLRTCAMPKCVDGVRRVKCGIVRNTYADLQHTTLRTCLDWFENIGIEHHVMNPRIQYEFKFNDGNGPIELELLFVALDRGSDIIRILKGLECTFMFVEELAEMLEDVIVHAKARCNRFPSDSLCPTPYWHGIFCATNPPAVDHWIYAMFEKQKLDSHAIFHQPPAVIKTKDGYEVNPEADNLSHQKDDYYPSMIRGQSEEFVKVYGMGEYGIVNRGQRVYHAYNDDLHSTAEIDIDPEYPILLGVDYGSVSPAILLGQLVDGQNRAIKEFVCQYMTIRDLYRTSVKPFLAKYCSGMMLEIAQADPANTLGGQEQLEQEGLAVEPARTNNIDKRLAAVTEFLTALTPTGAPRFLVSRLGCPKLREGFLGAYHYKKLFVIGEERYKETPDKDNHPFSDIHDCNQYICLFVGDTVFAEMDTPDWRDLTYYEHGKSEVGGY